jgi:hypothetical protein
LTVSGVVADAALVSATKFGLSSAGATDHFWDDFSVSGPSYTTLFTGYVDEWPVEWPGGTETMSTVTVTASSRMARLGRSTEFKSIVEEEVLYDSPVLYFPLGEPANSTTAGNIAPGRTEVLTTTQTGAGGTLTFGGGTGPGTDDLTSAVFAPVDGSNGLHLRSTLSSPLVSSQVIALEAWVVPTVQAWTQIVVGIDALTAAGIEGFFLRIDPGGTASMAPGSGGAFVVTPGSICDGNVHHLVGKFSLSGGTLSTTFIVDGVVVGTNSAAEPARPQFATLLVGIGDETFNNAHYSGSASHVAVYSGTLPTNARFIEHYNAGSTSFGEASGARVARYARLAGVPSAEVSTETGLSTSVAHKDTTGESPVSMMEAVAETEDGVVFDAGDGTLTFHSRSHRYAASSSFTLDCDAGDIESGFLPRLDDQHLTNDMTASRPEGVKIRSINAASIAEYGYYRDTVEILTTSDNEVQSRADWQVQRFGTPRVTVPDVAVELTGCSSALVASLLAAEIGTLFTVDNLPTQAPAATTDYFVEGITHDIGVNSFRISFNTSPAEYANVWTLDSASRSQLDTSTVLAY